MATIKIITKKCNNQIPIIKVDDNFVNLKSNKKGSFEGEAEIGADFKLNISLLHELEAKNWKLVFFFHWLISLFGFLNYKYGSKIVPELNFEAQVKAPDNNEITIAFYYFSFNKHALKITGLEENYNNETNFYRRKTAIEKRIKKLKWFKFLGFIILVSLIFLIINLIIK